MAASLVVIVVGTPNVNPEEVVVGFNVELVSIDDLGLSALQETQTGASFLLRTLQAVHFQSLGSPNMEEGQAAVVDVGLGLSVPQDAHFDHSCLLVLTMQVVQRHMVESMGLTLAQKEALSSREVEVDEASGEVALACLDSRTSFCVESCLLVDAERRAAGTFVFLGVSSSLAFSLECLSAIRGKGRDEVELEVVDGMVVA